MELRVKAGDLRPEHRAAIEAMLGQKLGDTDTVRVGAEADSASNRNAHESAEHWNRFAQELRELHKVSKHMDFDDSKELELAALVDEVIHEIHRNSE